MTRYAYQTKSLDPELIEHDAGQDVESAIEALTAKTTVALTKSAADYKRLDDALCKLESKMGRPGAHGPGAANDNTKAGALGAEHKSLAGFVRTVNDSELKAMSVGTDPEGGYFESPALSDQMTKRIFDQ